MENIEKKIHESTGFSIAFLFFIFIHFILCSFLSGTELLYKTLIVL